MMWWMTGGSFGLEKYESEAQSIKRQVLLSINDLEGRVGVQNHVQKLMVLDSLKLDLQVSEFKDLVVQEARV